MRVGSLFSGIGGIDLGLERAGMKVVWQVENNEFCQKVLKRHWPEVPCYGDIKEIDFTTLPAVDLICGGFPCQPWSNAGRRQGTADARNLWPETLRAVRESKPRWCLFENVPGILTHKYFGRIIGDLAESGYCVEWSVLSACSMGAPHSRERLFILSYSDSVNDSIQSREKEKIFERTWGTESRRVSGWTSEPDVGRVAHGIPARVDRLKCLGNAVVPQVAEWIGRRIMEAEATSHKEGR